MCYLLHGSGLGSRTYSGHRQTHVDGWADTLVEQLSLQEDLRFHMRILLYNSITMFHKWAMQRQFWTYLSVCDGNDIGGDVG